MSKRKIEELVNYITAKKPTRLILNLNSDEEKMRFLRKSNINRITSFWHLHSDIDKCNRKNSECNEDIMILQELVIEEERNDTEESTIQFSKWNEFNGRQ